MAWKPGESGNPEGARVHRYRFKRILDRVLTQEESKPDEQNRIRLGLEKVMDKVAEGDLPSIQLIADRSDGKPQQQIDHGNADGQPFQVRFDSPDADA